MLLIPQLVCLKLPDPAVAALLCRDVLFRVHGTRQNRKVQSDNGAVFPDNPALWRHHRVRKDLFQVIKGTVLHTAVDQKLVGIRTEHVADLRIRLAAKLQLGKANCLWSFPSRERPCMVGGIGCPQSSRTVGATSIFSERKESVCPAACCPGYLTIRGILMSGS